MAHLKKRTLLYDSGTGSLSGCRDIVARVHQKVRFYIRMLIEERCQLSMLFEIFRTTGQLRIPAQSIDELGMIICELVESLVSVHRQVRRVGSLKNDLRITAPDYLFLSDSGGAKTIGHSPSVHNPKYLFTADLLYLCSSTTQRRTLPSIRSTRLARSVALNSRKERA